MPILTQSPVTHEGDPSLADTYWQEVAEQRGALEGLLHLHYPDANWQDCEDAVSEAMLRVILRLPVRNIRAYLFQVSRTTLRAQHEETDLQTRVRPGLLLPGNAWHASPEARVMAAHDSRYYLALLHPAAQARLLTTSDESDRAIAAQQAVSVNAIKTGNKRARQALRQARALEEEAVNQWP
jgi:DNA-directed RNA polymerase specialized sigma24 family protein